MTYDYKYKSRVVDCKNDKILSRKKLLESFDISNGSLYNWLSKHNSNTLDTKTVRKPKVTPVIRCYIRQYVLRRPLFDKCKLIKQIYKKFNIKISKSTIYKIIEELHITRKRIKKKFIYTDKRKRTEQIKSFKQIIKNTPLTNIISIDETSIDTHITSNFGWSLRGKKITITKTEKRIRYTVLCAIDINKVVHIKIIKNSSNAQIFLDFIKELVNKLPTNQQSYILLDNARIHHALIFKDYIKTYPLINLIYNVPYSPEYNPIERVFNDVKNNLKRNNITNGNIQTKIKLAFKKVLSININNYYNKSLIM